jgi:hypothetical protein
MVHKGEVRDRNIDYLLRKVFIPAWDVVKNVGTQTAIFAPGTLSVGWSFGSPSYSQVLGSHIGGIRLAATLTQQIDHLWRVPSDVDKNHPIYFRHHWTSMIGGATPTIQFSQAYQTVSVGTAIQYMSPTSAIPTDVPASTNASTGTVLYNITGRGAIAPLATGVAANQVMDDITEALHLTISAGSTNWAIKSLPVWWLGMDIEYTPRLTFGDGSRREGRKLESNLGFSEAGASSSY